MRLTRTLFVLTSLLILGMANTASAYNPSGHFESVGFIVAESLGDLQLITAEKYVVTACAQLPDMNQQMDAVKTYVVSMHESALDWIGWSTRDHLGNARLQQMFAVQQLLHALTGGNSAAMHSVSLATLVKLKNQVRSGPKVGPQRVANLCALGLGLHLWGDTFAHTHVTWDQDAAATQLLTTYPTGRGHGLAEGHLPDDILCSYYSKDGPRGDINCHEDWDNSPHRRFVLWEAYWSKLGPLLDLSDTSSVDFDKSALSPTYSDDKMKSIEAAIKLLYTTKGKGALTPDGFDPVLGGGIQEILEPDPILRSKDGMAPFRSKMTALDRVGFTSDYPSCDSILAIILSLPGVQELAQGEVNCAAVWQQYYPSAIASFKSVIAAAAKSSGGSANALPVDPDWREIYGDVAGKGGAPIECYAKEVALPVNALGTTCSFVN
jgi:hypothetical protein